MSGTTVAIWDVANYTYLLLSKLLLVIEVPQYTFQ